MSDEVKTGMECPQCKDWIAPTIENLVIDRAVVCMGCGLRLSINASSQPVIDRLREYYEASRRVDHARNPYR